MKILEINIDYRDGEIWEVHFSKTWRGVPSVRMVKAHHETDKNWEYTYFKKDHSYHDFLDIMLKEHDKIICNNSEEAINKLISLGYNIKDKLYENFDSKMINIDDGLALTSIYNPAWKHINWEDDE